MNNQNLKSKNISRKNKHESRVQNKQEKLRISESKNINHKQSSIYSSNHSDSSRKLCSTNHHAAKLNIQFNINELDNKKCEKKVKFKTEAIKKQKKNIRKNKQLQAQEKESQANTISQTNYNQQYLSSNKKKVIKSSKSQKKLDEQKTLVIHCDLCKEDKESIFLKYKTEVLKCTFLKQQVQKLKKKLSKLKLQSKLNEGNTNKKINQKRLTQVDIFQLNLQKPYVKNNKDRYKVQSEIRRLKNNLQKERFDPQEIMDSFNQVIIILNKSIADLEDSNHNKISEISNLMDQINKIKQIKQKTDDELKGTKNKLKKIIESNVKLEDQIVDLKQQLKMSKAFLNNQKTDTQSIENKFNQLYKEYKNLINDHSNLLNKQQEIIASNSKLQVLRSQLQNQFEKNLRELQFLHQENNFLKIQNQKLKLKKRQNQNLCISLQKELNQLKQKSLVEKQRLIISKQKLQQQYISKSKEALQVDKLQNRILSLSKQNEQLRKQINLRDLDNQNLLNQVKNIHKMESKKQLQYQKIIQSNQVLIESLQISKEQIRCLSRQLQQIKIINENYKNKLLIQSKREVFEEQIIHEKQFSKEGKIKALTDIYSLIKKHRKQNENS